MRVGAVSLIPLRDVETASRSDRDVPSGIV
jgi:hypothetical protein